MEEWLLDILACPWCKQNLDLYVAVLCEEEIREGRLICQICNAEFPTKDSIP